MELSTNLQNVTPLKYYVVFESYTLCVKNNSPCTNK